MGDVAIKLFGLTIPLQPPVSTRELDAAKEEELQKAESAIESSAGGTGSDEVETSSGSREDNPAKNSKEMTPLKKPDRILPCPRCSSMDTKFCYYNNYNVNQPRHFCKNCQRYWTDGGTMRNVPVGAGRRKNKTSAAHCTNQIQPDVTELAFSVPNNVNGCTVVPFNSFADQLEQRSTGQTGEITGAGGDGMHTKEVKNDAPNSINGNFWPCAPPPAYYHPGIAIPFYLPTAAAAASSSSYWSCIVPSPWGFFPSGICSSPPLAPVQSASHKRRRDGDAPMSRMSDNASIIYIPKTLRIDGPEAAAKSSIWSIIGVKNDRAGSGDGRKLAEMFEPKGCGKGFAFESAGAPPHPNPAATARSASFREGS